MNSHTLDRLLSGHAGHFAAVRELPGSGPSRVFSTTMGDLSVVQDNIVSVYGRPSGVELGGSGSGTDPDLARLISMVEALERYSSCVPDTNLEIATPGSSPDRRWTLERLPRCTDKELAHPKCAVTALHCHSRIRWTHAFNMMSGEPVPIPAHLVWLHLPPVTRAERFTMPISTGCAAHFDIWKATSNALCEVVERDAIALIWLKRLALPRIVIDTAHPEIRARLQEKTDNGIEVRLYDATTDVGLPTIYSVEIAPASQQVHQMVMCASGFDYENVLLKVLREATASRVGLSQSDPAPADVWDFTGVFHGATFMAAQEHFHEFDFLDATGEQVKFSELSNIDARSPRAQVEWLIERLHDLDMVALIKNIQTREASSVGLEVVRVVIPDLMPLSFHHAARYLAHDRLNADWLRPRSQPDPRSDDGINVMPQPFA